jgi:hypothetical protein
MGLKNYRLVVSRPMDLAEDDDESPHLEILLDVDGTRHRVAVNVRSSQHPHPLLYQRRDPFDHPSTDRLAELPSSVVDLKRDRSDLVLDYMRGGSHKGTNGPNQDGALYVHFGGDNRWIAVFLGFQSQSWDTDPLTGHPLGDSPPRDPIDRSPDLDAPIEIVAALVNPPNPEEGRETVTLLNRTDAAVDLAGWAVADRMGRRTPLDGTVLEVGECVRVWLDASATRLGNKEGEIVLVDSEGEVVHHVRYARRDLGAEGWTVVF